MNTKPQIEVTEVQRDEEGSVVQVNVDGTPFLEVRGDELEVSKGDESKGAWWEEMDPVTRKGMFSAMGVDSSSTVIFEKAYQDPSNRLKVAVLSEQSIRGMMVHKLGSGGLSRDFFAGPKYRKWFLEKLNKTQEHPGRRILAVVVGPVLDEEGVVFLGIFANASQELEELKELKELKAALTEDSE